jgi:hypothetical protein
MPGLRPAKHAACPNRVEATNQRRYWFLLIGFNFEPPGLSGEFCGLRGYARSGVARALAAVRHVGGAGGIGKAMSVAMRQPFGVRTQSTIMGNGFGTGVCPA